MSGCFYISVQFAGTLLAALLAAGQFALKNRNTSNYFYAFTFISITLWSGVYSLRDFLDPGGWLLTSVIPDLVSQTAYSLTAVLFYFLMQSIFNPSFRIRGVACLFFFPGIFAFFMLMLSHFFYNRGYCAVREFTSSALYIFSIFVYLLILWQVNVLRRLSGDRGNRKAILKIMIFLSIAAILTIIPQLTCLRFKDSYSVTMLTVLFYIVTMRYPESLVLLREEAEKARYVRSKITGLDVGSTRYEIERRVRDHRLFLKSDLTLKELAEAAGITPHQLSEILNVYYKKNFHDFINFYRIEEAKRIFSADKSATAIGICFRVGFNSNSAFYRAFKKETGISPARYRRGS